MKVIALRDPALLRDRAYVGGAWIGGTSTFTVRDPATGATLAEVADLGAAETTAAVRAAADAMPAWAARTAKERAAVLRRWFELIMAAQDDLAMLMTSEQGKPLAEARGEVAYGASFLEWCAEEAKRVYGEVIPTPVAGRRLLALRQPVGVAAAITPWNFPVAMLTRKAGPALAAGCAFVVKPAAETPLCALALAELAHRAGVPAGVFNVVTSTRAQEVGLVLTQDPLVRKFSFTGSTPVGKQLMAQCATTVKRVSLELGGNAPFLVFDDADLDAAVAGGGGLAVPERGTDVRLREPVPRARVGRGSLHGEARSGRVGARRGRRDDAGSDAGAADLGARGGEGRAARGGRGDARRARGVRRLATRARRDVLRADRARGGGRGDGDRGGRRSSARSRP
jgi:hypothetical protein